MARFVIIAVFVVLASGAWAKRVPPRPVAPVIDHGIEYSATGDGRTQYVVATDIATSKELWRARIFHTRIEPWLEEDVQWVFISELKLGNRELLIKDEKSRCYRLDLQTRRVKKQWCW